TVLDAYGNTAAAEVDGAGVAGGGVAVGVEHRGGGREGVAGGCTRRCTHEKRRGCSGVDGERRVSGDRGGDRVGAGDAAAAGLGEREAVAEGVHAVVAAGEGVV